MEKHGTCYPIRLLCEILSIYKSGYYNWLNLPVGKREKKQNELRQMIKIIFNEHRSRYGSTRIFHKLKARGILCTRAKVVELMNDMNLIAKARRKYKVTTDSNHNKQVAPNLLTQDFRATGLNQKWVLISVCRAKRLER